MQRGRDARGVPRARNGRGNCGAVDLPSTSRLLGASAFAVAAYGTLRELLDALYPYPGGCWLTGWPRRALELFALLSAAGYAPSCRRRSGLGSSLGRVLVMAWSSLTLPAIFAVLGDSLPAGRRATGFGVQSILKRVPIILAPPLGGLLIAGFGFRSGVRAGLGDHHRSGSARDLGAAPLLCRPPRPAVSDGERLGSLWRSIERS